MSIPAIHAADTSYTAYVNLVNNLHSKGRTIHGIGIQATWDSTFQSPKYYSDVLQPLAGLGLPIWVTEFDAQ